MNTSAAHTTDRPIVFRGLACGLAILSLLPALASCTDAASASGTSASTSAGRQPTLDTQVVAAEPGCRKEFPVEYRGISCAGHDYDPPAIPFGELYPPR
ncbi:hypothetical protein [Variovorax paradoxus]|uniref:hypothetical protein n=1 Tax=Variovorax paradoxus TaxID=34073 RepID=UPI0005AD1CF5|nr:hypothetical protein [Variovorax paradoxus]